MATGYVGRDNGGGIRGRTTDSRGFYFAKIYRGSSGGMHPFDVYNMRCDALGGVCDTNSYGRWSDSYYATSISYYGWPQYDGQLTSELGKIESMSYYVITANATTIGSSSEGGSLSGGGVYWEDSLQCTLTAKPDTGFVLKSLTGYSGTLPTKNQVNLTFTVTSDQTYTAEFQKVYNIVYDANGGDTNSVPVDNEYHYYNSGTDKDYVTIPSKIPTRDGYVFLGWSSSKSATTPTYIAGNRHSDITSLDSIVLYAVWKQYSVSFNGLERATPSTLPNIAGVPGDTVRLPAYNAATRANYSIGGWMIGGETCAPGSEYVLGNSDVMATAVWASVKIVKHGTGAYAAEDLDDIGTLVVKSSEDDYGSSTVPLVEMIDVVTGEMPNDVPYDAEVEYLEGGGSGTNSAAYILTDFTLSYTDMIEAKVTPVDDNGSYGIWCSRGNGPTINSMTAEVSGGRIRIAYKGENKNISDFQTASGIPVVVRADANKFYINEDFVNTFTFASFNTPAPVSLFCTYYFQSTSNTYRIVEYKKSRFNYLCVWRDGSIIHYLIPVRFTNDDGESEGAVYDLIDKKMYTNAGGGSFTYGSDVANPHCLGKYWRFAPKPNTTYRVSCAISTELPDKLWSFMPPDDIAFGSMMSSVDVAANFSRKEMKEVTTEVQTEAGSINPGEMDNAKLVITIPSAPDEIAPGQTPPYTYGNYITGQAVKVTAQYPEGVVGWNLVNAFLNIGGVTSTPIPTYIKGNDINIPASNFTDDMHIIGMFGRIDCDISAGADEPSADAVSGVDVKKEDPNEGWVNAQKAKYGETVRVFATVDTENGYELDGIYANGERIATEIPTVGYVTHVVHGDTHFVVKAKVRVSLGVGHWSVDDDDWTESEDCDVAASVDGTPVEDPGDGFEVVLGQSVAYEVNIRNGWHFNAWFEGTEEEKPTSFDNPIGMPISDVAFKPTAPLAVIARVTDAIISYETEISFVNNDNPNSPETLTADVANVTSFPAADDAGTEDGKVVLTYSSGTKSCTLTFAEAIAGTNLVFDSLLEKVGSEWKPAEVDSTVYSMLTSKNRTLKVLYTSNTERTVTVAYANIEGVSPETAEIICGEIGIVESNYPELNPNGKTFVGMRGDLFTIRAIPRNGWRFVGWYYAPTHIGTPKYTGQDTVATVITTRTLYAYFVQDTHAVYEWEGRNENKMMTWRSKVYVSPRPFNPSAIRVDVTDPSGRVAGVKRVEVGMMSSPDAADANPTVLANIPNYVARRLQHKRPERYLQVEVQHNAEVDRILVGTSMEGIAV